MVTVILILKIRKSKICRGGSIDSQLSLSHGKVIASVDPGGRIDD